MWIRDYCRRDPNISICELYGKLREDKAYKYVPTACYVGKVGEEFYQYTMTDEASRERFIFPYKGQSGFLTVDFVKRAITCFGYAPKMIQTDNGTEFTNFSQTKRVHIFDRFRLENRIEHKLIRPRTPY